MTVDKPANAVPAADLPDAAIAIPPPRRGRRQTLELWLPLIVLTLMVLLCFLGPVILPVPGPNAGSLLNANLSPGRGHLLGTDIYGNDVFSRCLYGGRVSIEVGLGAVALGLLVGITLGTIAGFAGGAIETLIMRMLDLLLAFPSLVLALTIATYLGPSERNVIIAIAFFTIPAFSRLSRAATIRLRERVFIVAATLGGRKGRAIIVRHILPNIAPELLTYALITVAAAMLVEAALSFLGFGIPPPQPTWGNMISTGQTRLATEPWLLLAPSGFLFVTILALNLLGDALRRRWSSA